MIYLTNNRAGKQARFTRVEHTLTERFIVIAGPTAVGKTDLSIQLARSVGGEIINADSMQVYRGLDIGTAKPTADEIDGGGIPFHLLDVINPDEQYTAAAWRTAALEAISAIAIRGRLPVVSGGTGMYIRALLYDWTMADTPADAAIRARLRSELDVYGSASLHVRLNAVDPVTAQRLHPNDAIRIVRALEVFEACGTQLSVLHERDKVNRRAKTKPVLFFLLERDRETLYTRIDARVDQMIVDGLVDEVDGLLKMGYSRSAPGLQGLGYREICAYLNGETNLVDAISHIKMNTRRFAKRQITWFRTERDAQHIDLSANTMAEAQERIASAAVRFQCSSN